MIFEYTEQIHIQNRSQIKKQNYNSLEPWRRGGEDATSRIGSMCRWVSTPTTAAARNPPRRPRCSTQAVWPPLPTHEPCGCRWARCHTRAAQVPLAAAAGTGTAGRQLMRQQHAGDVDTGRRRQHHSRSVLEVQRRHVVPWWGCRVGLRTGDGKGWG